MPGDKYIVRESGKLKEARATDVSTGASEAGDLVGLGPDGKLDLSLLPTGVGPDVGVFVASEALSAGEYVNIYDDGGTPSIRLADSTNGRPAHGFVKDAVASAANGTVYFEGANSSLSGLTIGARYYLTAAGAVTLTPPDAPTDTIHQYLGIATSATEINTDIEDCIGLIA